MPTPARKIFDLNPRFQVDIHFVLKITYGWVTVRRNRNANISIGKNVIFIDQALSLFIHKNATCFAVVDAVVAHGWMTDFFDCNASSGVGEDVIFFDHSLPIIGYTNTVSSIIVYTIIAYGWVASRPPPDRVYRGNHTTFDQWIVGFDDVRPASYINPPLTTVRQPLQEMGRRAMKMVLGLIDKAPVQNELLDCELVVRASVAPPLVPPTTTD